MQEMVFIAAGALIIGLTLGLLGSGGSTLTVPVLIYLVGHGGKESIAESMAIVGLISIAAAVPYAAAGKIDWRSVGFFGIPAMLGTFFGAWIGGTVAEVVQLVVFGVVLLAAAFVMLQAPQPVAESPEVLEEEKQFPLPAWKIALQGGLVGLVTGFVGVGGGFLIVPALVAFGRLPMRLAIGTSLVIISLNAAIGFAKYQHYLLAHQSSVNGAVILTFVVIGIAGSLLGGVLNARLSGWMLKRVFAVFLVLIGGFVIVQEGGKWFFPAVRASQIRSVQQTSELSRAFHTHRS